MFDCGAFNVDDSCNQCLDAIFGNPLLASAKISCLVGFYTEPGFIPTDPGCAALLFNLEDELGELNSTHCLVCLTEGAINCGEELEQDLCNECAPPQPDPDPFPDPDPEPPPPDPEPEPEPPPGNTGEPFVADGQVCFPTGGASSPIPSGDAEFSEAFRRASAVFARQFAPEPTSIAELGAISPGASAINDLIFQAQARRQQAAIRQQIVDLNKLLAASLDARTERVGIGGSPNTPVARGSSSDPRGQRRPLFGLPDVAGKQAAIRAAWIAKVNAQLARRNFAAQFRRRDHFLNT